MTNKFRKSAFTLIELLAVLVISAIVLGITLPSLNTLIKGQSVEQAALNLGSELKAVRSFAITNREYVALIFPTVESGITDRYKYKSYRPCIVNSSDVFQFWIAGNKWEFLPTGAAVLTITTKSHLSARTIKDFEDATDITNVNLSRIGGLNNATVKGIVFKSNGKSGSRTFIVVGGAASVRTGVSETTGTFTDTNLIDITIDQHSGRISYGKD